MRYSRIFGIASFIIQLVVSFLRRDQLRETSGDPWNARTLEWSTASPPPAYNFAETPHITELDAWARLKASGGGMFVPAAPYGDIHMPSNTAAGFLIGILSIGLGFGLVWYIWWLVAVTGLAMFAVLLHRLFEADIAFVIPAAEVRDIEMRRLEAGAGQP